MTVALALALLCPAIAAVAARGGSAPRGSSGCSRALPAGIYPGAGSVPQSRIFDGVQRSWRVLVPGSYSPTKPVPLVLSIHGWGGTGLEDEHDGGLGLMAEKHGFIALFPDGLSDNDNFGGPWGGWNVVGTTQSPGPAGPTCAAWADAPTYCYQSCKARGRCYDKPQCQWTTCENDITPSGVGTEASGFLKQLLDLAESEFCIDVTREYATGQSNGGMATYQVGASMSSRLAAIAPVAGSFHAGFGQVPTVPMPVLDVHGNSDRIVPPNDTTAANGWYYVVTGEILGGWAVANGCSGAKGVRLPYPTSLDGVMGLSCVAHGTGCAAPAVACSYTGSHTYFANNADANGQLVWEFLSKFSRPSHLGRGVSDEGSDEAPLEEPSALIPDLVGGAEAASPPAGAVRLEAQLRASAHDSWPHRGHYRDPKTGCRSDEDHLELTDGISLGRLCAPRIPMVRGEQNSQPQPKCIVGGRFPDANNGCPKDVPIPAQSKVWPICLQVSSPSQASSFNCLLVCGPCRDDPLNRPNTCSDSAHDSCPSGARCMLGHLRAVNQGVCVYVDMANSTGTQAPVAQMLV